MAIFASAAIAACYGVLHDQVTYSISPEYFTKLKFHQFAWADPGGSERLFVAVIGLLATWWVGCITGWFLARRLIPDQSRDAARRRIYKGFAIVILTALLFESVAGTVWSAFAIEWPILVDDRTADELRITNTEAFRLVALIHLAG